MAMHKFCQHTCQCWVEGDELVCWGCGRTVPKAARFRWQMFNLACLVVAGSFVTALGILASKILVAVLT